MNDPGRCPSCGSRPAGAALAALERLCDATQRVGEALRLPYAGPSVGDCAALDDALAEALLVLAASRA